MRRVIVVAVGLVVAASCACAVLILAILLDGPMRHIATVLATVETMALAQALLHGDGLGPMVGFGLDALRKAALALCFAPVAFAALLGEATQTASLAWYAGLSGGSPPPSRPSLGASPKLAGRRTCA